MTDDLLVRPKAPPIPGANVATKSASDTPPVGATTQPAPTTTAPPSAAPTTQNPYGSAGNLTNVDQSTFNPNSLPPWLAQQFFQTQGNNNADPGGTGPMQWSYKYNLKDQAGNDVVQTGQGPQSLSDGLVKDKSLITYDPVLGWVTPPDNIIYTPSGGLWNLVGPASIPLILGAGLGLDALYGFNGFGDAGAVGGAANLGDTSLLPTIPPTTIPDLPPVPQIADGFTPGINQAIDTSLIPSVTPTTIPDVPAPPDITSGIPPALTPGGGVTTPSGGMIPGTDNSIFTGTTPTDVPNPYGDVTIPPAGGGGGGGGGGGTSFVDRITNSVMNDPLRAAGTALTVGTALGNHSADVPQGLQNTVNNNSAIGPQANATLANNGAPTPDQMAVIKGTIDQQRKEGIEAIIQASVNAGQGGKESMVVQDKIRAFNEQLTVMQNQLVQKQAEQNVAIAMQELGMMTQEQFQLAQMQLQQDNAAQQRAIMQIMQSLGWLWGGGGKGTTPAATPPIG